MHGEATASPIVLLHYWPPSFLWKPLNTHNSKKSQLDKFKEAARQLQADDDEERFEERLKDLVRPEPKGRDKSK